MQGHQATMGMQIQPGMVGVGIGYSAAMHSGMTPSGIIGHHTTVHTSDNGGRLDQVNATSVSGEIGVTTPLSCNS